MPLSRMSTCGTGSSFPFLSSAPTQTRNIKAKLSKIHAARTSLSTPEDLVPGTRLHGGLGESLHKVVEPRLAAELGFRNIILVLFTFSIS